MQLSNKRADHLKYNPIVISYNLNFNGFMVNLDNTAEDKCEEVIGEFGISPEFYFHQGKLSKIHFETTTPNDIYILNPQESKNLLGNLKPDVTNQGIFLNPLNQKNISPNISDLYFSFNDEYLAILFERSDTYFTPEGINFDNVEIYELNPMVRLGINGEEKSLCFLFLKLPFDKIQINDTLVNSSLIGESRYHSIKTILKESFNLKNHTTELFNGLIQKHNDRFTSMTIDAKILNIENELLNMISERFKHEKNIFG